LAGQLPATVREYRIASTLEPKNVAALLGLARSAAAAGDTGAARDAVNRLLQSDPMNMEAAQISARLPPPPAAK